MRKLIALAALASAATLTGCQPTLLTTLDHGVLDVSPDVQWNVDLGPVLDWQDEARVHGECDQMGGTFVLGGPNAFCIDVDH